MGPARIYPLRKMHRSRAPSIAPGTFFVAQSWADCITNMAGFNLRQPQVSNGRAKLPHSQQLAQKPLILLEKLGGRTRARTWDPMIKSHLLYQLSYAPETGRESLRKRASFSKASPRCPASRCGIPGLSASPGKIKKAAEFNGF